MSEDSILERVKEASEKLALPWVYFSPEDQIYSQNVEVETGDFGEELSKGNELIGEFHGLKRSKEIIDGVNLLPELITEVEDLRKKYQYMVDNAAANKLDGYRELGKRAADAEAEVERLRSVAEERYQRAWDLSGEIYELRREIAGLKGRIKELKAENERLGAAFLKAESQRLWDLGKSTGETSYDCQEAREALEEIKNGMEN